MNIKNSHILKIKQIYPDTTDITKPSVPGNVHDIYIATTSKNKFVCRFSDKQMAQHNYHVSNLLAQHNIPAPKVSIYKCGTEYCETYPFINGKTLHERLKEGMSSEKIYNVYSQLFDISSKISKLPFESIAKTKKAISAKLSEKFFTILNYSDIRLSHVDLHAKNIIVDDNDNIKAILDLDAICPERVVVPMINIIANAKSYGYDIKNIMRIYSGNSIKPKFISLEAQIRFYSALKTVAKRILGDFMVKQILKIRVR